MPSGTERMAGPDPSAGTGRVALGGGRKGVAVAFLVVVLLAAVASGLTRSALFDARTIRVHGATHLSRAEVLRIAAIAPGTNVFTLDTADAQRRLEREPWVATATVTKDLPSTVAVEIRERVAVAVAESGGVLRLVADDGVLLDAALPRLAANLTRIAPAEEGVGEPTVVAIGGAARAVAALTSAVRARVSVVSILADGQLRVDLSSGAEVAYGPAVDLVEKAQAMRALLDWAAGQGASLSAADVRVPSAPTAELVGGGATAP
jgi:cell division protein FtsQ